VADTVVETSDRRWTVPEQYFASLPWYDLPEIRDATDAFWRAIAAALQERGIADVPAALDRTLPYSMDFNSKCLFTQTCGYPLLTTSRSHFHVLGTPCYNAPGCAGPEHRAFIVARAASTLNSLEDLRGKTFAINELDSNSGMNLPRLLFAPLNHDGGFLGGRIITGSHAASAEAVEAGEADAASIDCVSFALFQRYRPAAIKDLRILAETAPTLAPPFVTSSRSELATIFTLREVLLEVMHDFRHVELREALLLDDVKLAGDDDYNTVLDYEREAKRLGYPVLV